MTHPNSSALARFIGEMSDMGVTDGDELLRAGLQFLAVQRSLPTVLSEMN